MEREERIEIIITENTKGLKGDEKNMAAHYIQIGILAATALTESEGEDESLYRHTGMESEFNLNDGTHDHDHVIVDKEAWLRIIEYHPQSEGVQESKSEKLLKSSPTYGRNRPN